MVPDHATGDLEPNALVTSAEEVSFLALGRLCD